MKRKSISGFSLVELMVTIAIIGIIAAIGSAQLKRFKLAAMQAEAKIGISHLAQLIQVAPDEDLANGLWPAPCTGSFLGFTLAKCSAARYNYFGLTNTTGIWEARAVEKSGPKIFACKVGATTFYDYWYKAYNNGDLNNVGYIGTVGPVGLTDVHKLVQPSWYNTAPLKLCY